jgi:hypothetical protein
LIKKRATGITKSKNARLPKRKYLFLNIFMQSMTTDLNSLQYKMILA